MSRRLVLDDTVISVLVITSDFRRIFPNCHARVSGKLESCRPCKGANGRIKLAGDVLEAVRQCIISAPPASISALKKAVNVEDLVVYEKNADTGTRSQRVF